MKITLNIISVMKQYLQFLSLLESLSKDVFERRMSIGSEAFSIFICLDADKFVLPSFFSLIKTIYPRVSTKPLPNDAKSPLLVDFRRSKTLLLKLPIILDKKYHYCSLNQRNEFFHFSNFPGSLMLLWAFHIAGAPSENIVQNHLNIALLNVF